jgi:hypothetical protein
MSESAVDNALVRLLEERGENWRMLADLAVDFSPPHVARAASAAMSDPSSDPATVLDAIRSAPTPVLDDSPLHVGSIEPETLDFAPVSTIIDGVTPEPADIDLDFGAGTADPAEILDQIASTYEDDGFGSDLPSVEVDHGLTPDHVELVEGEPVLAVEDDFAPDEDGDDGDPTDVGD